MVFNFCPGPAFWGVGSARFCIASSVNYAWVDVTDCGSYTGGQVAVSPPSADSLCCFATEESCGMVSQGLNAAHSTPCSSGEYMVGAATSGSLLTCNPANCLAGSQYCVDVAPVRAYSNHTGFVFTGENSSRPQTSTARAYLFRTAT